MADVFEKYVTPRPEVNPTIYALSLIHILCLCWAL